MVETILYVILLGVGIFLGFVMASRVASIRLRNQEMLWQERMEGRVKERISQREEELRREAAARSGRALSGNVLEKFSPLMEQFPFDPHDAVWIGSPVDFLVFDGLSLDRHHATGLKRIVLVEVKSGFGKLSKRQRRIREIVDKGRVEWKEIRIPT